MQLKHVRLGLLVRQLGHEVPEDGCFMKVCFSIRIGLCASRSYTKRKKKKFWPIFFFRVKKIFLCCDGYLLLLKNMDTLDPAAPQVRTYNVYFSDILRPRTSTKTLQDFCGDLGIECPPNKQQMLNTLRDYQQRNGLTYVTRSQFSTTRSIGFIKKVRFVCNW